jgi:hypothetical protein
MIYRDLLFFLQLAAEMQPAFVFLLSMHRYRHIQRKITPICPCRKSTLWALMGRHGNLKIIPVSNKINGCGITPIHTNNVRDIMPNLVMSFSIHHTVIHFQR